MQPELRNAAKRQRIGLDAVAELIVEAVARPGIRIALRGRAAGRQESEDEHHEDRGGATHEHVFRYVRAPNLPATSCATSVGVVPTSMPTASSASFFACAVPAEPEMIAPA